jgi:hypothetical protein
VGCEDDLVLIRPPSSNQHSPGAVGAFALGQPDGDDRGRVKPTQSDTLRAASWTQFAEAKNTSKSDGTRQGGLRY